MGEDGDQPPPFLPDGSILPINLNGVIPMFNNISINNNIKSPGASNTTTQDFGVNAP
ncbi:hypothetical protein [Streptomyces sp. NPDC059262]|uniref:hypothetical protein n=1 Tax=Streptomyces sp. NPDC059262 TaxID=3346797 RepID=UPI0036873D94